MPPNLACRHLQTGATTPCVVLARSAWHGPHQRLSPHLLMPKNCMGWLKGSMAVPGGPLGLLATSLHAWPTQNTSNVSACLRATACALLHCSASAPESYAHCWSGPHWPQHELRAECRATPNARSSVSLERSPHTQF